MLVFGCRPVLLKWNSFKVEDSGQSHWNKSRHRRGNCEMHIFTAQYYHRLWGLFLSTFPMISAWLLIAADRTSDQEAANKQAWSLLPAKLSILHTHSLYAATQDSPIHIHVFVSGREMCVHAGCWHAGHSFRVVPKYLNCSTLLIFILTLHPAFWSWDMTMYLVLSRFNL
jgi:hypothetical protein